MVMEGKAWVLINKSDEDLYIKLSFHKVGKAKGKGRPVWEFTEDFREASGFNSSREIDDANRMHKIPTHSLKVRAYETAHLRWVSKPKPLVHDSR